MEDILFYLHYAVLLLFGILLSASFSGIRVFERKNLIQIFICFSVCGILQLLGLFAFGEETVWNIYPLITHIPIVFWLCVFYKKKAAAAFASVFSAYLCCQPAKWIGILVLDVFKSASLELLVRIAILAVSGFFAISLISPIISEIFSKDTKSVLVFGMIPAVYYAFDYSTGVYSEFWIKNETLVAEFLPFFLCITFFIFCIVYFREYELKNAAEQKEQIISLVSEQQKKEIENVQRTEQEIRYLRHDMRHILSGVASCIENGDSEKAKELISVYTQKIEKTRLLEFSKNETINCVLSDFAAKCEAFSVNFEHSVEIENIKTDEIVFASILSNALDNALNEQKKLLGGERNIHLMLKTVDGKLLLSVKNPTKTQPVFCDGIPVTNKSGHGYGCRSIRYMAEKLGGNSRFSLENGYFIVRVII